MPDSKISEEQLAHAKRINDAIQKLQKGERSSENESPRERLDRAAAEFEAEHLKNTSDDSDKQKP